MSAAEVAERVWYGDGALAAAARAALAPLESLFRAGVRARNARFDRGEGVQALPLPALSVGNLTVGGTGKTPVAAWIAAELRALGARPALVLRGVGGDEPRVHALLNPDVPVVTDADRVAGARAAAALGADVVVLDDAFQHRRAARDVDVVLVAAERFDARRVRLLPAGPYREGLDALRRASAVIVTRKAADAARAEVVARALAGAVPAVPVAHVHLAPDALHRWDASAGDSPVGLQRLQGARVLAVSGIGEPAAFHAQLAAAGARVAAAAFPDHHAYTAADAAALAARAEAADLVVCTLKDAVKLGPAWPRGAAPLWYVSQRVVVEGGGEVLRGLLQRLLSVRPAPPA